MRIVALDHIVLNVSDVERSLAFYTERLGFRPSESNGGGRVSFPSRVCGQPGHNYRPG